MNPLGLQPFSVWRQLCNRCVVKMNRPKDTLAKYYCSTPENSLIARMPICVIQCERRNREYAGKGNVVI